MDMPTYKKPSATVKLPRVKREIIKQINLLKKAAEMHHKRAELWSEKLVTDAFEMGFCKGSSKQGLGCEQLCRIQAEFLESLI